MWILLLNLRSHFLFFNKFEQYTLTNNNKENCCRKTWEMQAKTQNICNNRQSIVQQKFNKRKWINFYLIIVNETSTKLSSEHYNTEKIDIVDVSIQAKRNSNLSQNTSNDITLCCAQPIMIFFFGKIVFYIFFSVVNR